MKGFLCFLGDGLKAGLRGGAFYRSWLLSLICLMGLGVWHYSAQWHHGLILTGMSDQVSWGFYIANFVFFVGIAAAAVLLVIPAFIFHRQDVKSVVLIGEAMAVAAVLMAMGFVLVDVGRLDRLWHLIPYFGRLNWPSSLLAWDIIVLNGYLLLNLAIPLYVLFKRYRGREVTGQPYFFFMVIAMFWAIALHTVTAFVLSANVSRPMWHSALLAPRFIASAFVSGPALLILVLQIIRRYTDYTIKQSVIDLLALIMTVALQINLYFVASELFTDFYHETEHAASLRYLFLGIDGVGDLKRWMWLAMMLNLLAVMLLMVHKSRTTRWTLNLACMLGFVGIWIEKGMGLVIPGFIPTPLGEIFEYTPTLTELGVSLGIYASGAFVFTILTKGMIAIQLGQIGRYRHRAEMAGVTDR
jgi:molybdopterin-containing oxidoreductase family membrane subunit